MLQNMHGNGQKGVETQKAETAGINGADHHPPLSPRHTVLDTGYPPKSLSLSPRKTPRQ